MIPLKDMSYLSCFPNSLVPGRELGTAELLLRVPLLNREDGRARPCSLDCFHWPDLVWFPGCQGLSFKSRLQVGCHGCLW